MKAETRSREERDFRKVVSAVQRLLLGYFTVCPRVEVVRVNAGVLRIRIVTRDRVATEGRKGYVDPVEWIKRLELRGDLAAEITHFEVLTPTDLEFVHSYAHDSNMNRATAWKAWSYP